MTECPICKSELQQIEAGFFDGKTFRCPVDGEFEITDTVLASALMNANSEEWLKALRTAYARRTSAERPRIHTYDFDSGVQAGVGSASATRTAAGDGASTAAAAGSTREEPPTNSLPPFIANQPLDAAAEVAMRERRSIAAEIATGPTGPFVLRGHVQVTPDAADIVLKSFPPEVSISRTTIRVAVIQNREAIDLALAALSIQIDERLQDLRDKRLNSPEAEATIAHYEDLKQKVDALRDAASKSTASDTVDDSIVTATLSFTEGLSNWWAKRHMVVLDMGLFLTSVSICAMAGVSDVVVATCGVIVGGKRVADVLKEIAKK